MRWFARGRLWPSREVEHDDFQKQKQAALAPRERRRDRPGGSERRDGDWRPGGTHKDPRDRFKKKNRPERAWSEKDPATQRDRDKPGYAARRARRPGDDRARQDHPRVDKAWSNKPRDGRPETSKARRPWTDKPAPPSDRPWQTKPTGPRAQRKPWTGKPAGNHSRAKKPGGFAPSGDRPWRDSRGGSPPFKAAHAKPWQKRPFRPGPPPKPDARKRRDDEPPDRD